MTYNAAGANDVGGSANGTARIRRRSAGQQIGRLCLADPTQGHSQDLPLRVLSPADWDHWQRCGYVIVERAVPSANIERLVDLLWEFQEMDRNDPSTWNRP